MDQKLLVTLRQQAQILRPVVRIGKEGIHETVIAEIVKQLKKHQLIKVKLLHCFDKKEIAKELALKTESTIVQAVGGTIVLWRQ